MVSHVSGIDGIIGQTMVTVCSLTSLAELLACFAPQQECSLLRQLVFSAHKCGVCWCAQCCGTRVLVLSAGEAVVSQSCAVCAQPITVSTEQQLVVVVNRAQLQLQLQAVASRVRAAHSLQTCLSLIAPIALRHSSGRSLGSGCRALAEHWQSTYPTRIG